MESQETNNPQAEISATDSASEANPAPQGANPNRNNLETNSNTAPDAQAQKERFSDRRKIGFLGKLGMSQTNDRIYNKIGEVLNWLNDISKGQNISTKEINNAWQDTKAAIDLIERLSKDIEELRKEVTKQDKIKRYLESEKHKLEECNREWLQWHKIYDRNIKSLTEQRDTLNRKQQSFEKTYIQQVKELKHQCQQLTQELKAIQQEKEALERKLADSERSRDRLLVETASLKRNTGTHYEGTSERPQHHVLTGEYKTLKEQHLDPLANSLFNFLATSNPELKKKRKETLNDIKAAISTSVLLHGQEIMRGQSTALGERTTETLKEMKELLCQRLELDDQTFPQQEQVSELLKKAVTLAQGKVQYPAPGNWQDEDFQQASTELRDRLYQVSELNITSLSQELETEVQKAIQKALRFLERAAFADPPACLNLDNEGDSFDSNYHEAAKGWDDEGTVIKTIYPVYLVNGEAKVKAVVLTKKSGSVSSDAGQSSTNTNRSYSTKSESEPVETETNSTDINEDEKEKRIRLEAKRESLINSVKSKWFENQDSSSKDLESVLTEKLSKIEQLDIIETLEKEIHKVRTSDEFKKKLDELLIAASSQQSS